MRRFVVLAAALVSIAACGDDAAAPTTTTATVVTTAPEPTSTTGGGSTTIASTTSTTVDDGAIDITIVLGPTGLELIVDGATAESGSRLAVDLGTPIHLVFSGSVAEELHVHGYDLTIDLAPGAVETVDFTADIPGIFEVELEGAGTLVFELEVS